MKVIDHWLFAKTLFIVATFSAAALVSGCATTLPGLDFEYQENAAKKIICLAFQFYLLLLPLFALK